MRMTSESFKSTELLTIFLTVEALVLAAGTFGASVWVTRAAGKKYAPTAARHLAEDAFALCCVLTFGALCALIDLVTGGDRAHLSVFDWLQLVVVVLVILGIPRLAWRVRETTKPLAVGKPADESQAGDQQ
jgi:cytochrome c oxidase assembly factor CtaG